MSKRDHITCTRETAEGHPIAIADIGFSAQGVPMLYHWCRAHRQFHECTLEQVLAYFHTLSENDRTLRKNYTMLLSEALVRCYVL